MLAASLLVPGLAACKSDTAESAAPGGSASAAAPADPKEALLASTREIGKGNFTFTVVGHQSTGKGLVHKPSNSAQFTMTFDDGTGDVSMDVDFIYIEKESWVKLDLGGKMFEALGADKNKGKYQHLDQSKIEGAKGLQLNAETLDPSDSAALIKGVTEVRRTGEGSFAGTIDITGATESAALDEEVVEALAAQAKALPFTAKVDAQGRLTEIAIAVPAAGEAEAHEVKITYADYGSATAAQKPPASKVVEASEQTYEMFK